MEFLNVSRENSFPWVVVEAVDVGFAGICTRGHGAREKGFHCFQLVVGLGKRNNNNIRIRAFIV